MDKLPDVSIWSLVINAVVSIIGAFIALKLLPSDVRSRKVSTDIDLYKEWKQAINDVAELRKEIKALREERGEDVIVRTETHVVLSRPHPQVVSSIVEYVPSVNIEGGAVK